jgi:hypothetical protein
MLRRPEAPGIVGVERDCSDVSEASPQSARDVVDEVAIDPDVNERRESVVTLLRQLTEDSPSDAECWFSLAYGLYHLWKDPPADVRIEGLHAARRAVALNPTDQWSRLYEIYWLSERQDFEATLVACSHFDLDAFVRGGGVAWQVLSVLEAEFVALATLGIHAQRAAELASAIADLSAREQLLVYPYRPSRFLRGLLPAARTRVLDASDLTALAARAALFSDVSEREAWLDAVSLARSFLESNDEVTPG